MMNPIQALLYPDWDLEALLQNVDPGRGDEFSQVVSALQSGQVEEAEAWLAEEISQYPWVLMAAAYVKMKMNEMAEAGRLLRAVTLISSDARLRLWAWHSLRQLGKYPSPDLARQVLGVVIEVPIEDRVDVLAAYADGSARYINHQGGVIVWDRLDEVVTPLVMAAIREAQPIGEAQEDHAEEEVEPDQVRVSVLTPGGIYVWQGVPGENKALARLFAAMADLLRALVQAAMENRDPDDEDEDH